MAGVGEVAAAVTALVGAGGRIADRHDRHVANRDQAVADLRSPLPEPAQLFDAPPALSAELIDLTFAALEAAELECGNGVATNPGRPAEQAEFLEIWRARIVDALKPVKAALVNSRLPFGGNA